MIKEDHFYLRAPRRRLRCSLQTQNQILANPALSLTEFISILSGSLCTQSYRTHILAASDYSLVKEQQSKQTCFTNMRRQKLSSSPALIFFPSEDSKAVFGSVRGGGIVATIPTLSTPRRTQIRGDFFVHSCLRFRDPDHKNLLSETFDKPPAIQSAKKHHRQKCRRRTLRTGILLLSIGFASTTQPALRKECCKPQYATQIVSNRCSSVTAADPGRW